MAYNPNIHHRKSVRLKGYDYSRAGLYFITVCTKDRECFFGEIVGANDRSPEIILNDAGKIANDCWLEIPKHFPNTVLHGHIVMPNHVHGIIELTDNANVGTSHGMSLHDNMDDTVGTRHGVSLPSNPNQFGKPVSGSLSVIINQYKSSVKRWCNKNRQEHFQWQSRFHDHIIRNEQSYKTISEYIINNPSKWKEDKFFI